MNEALWERMLDANRLRRERNKLAAELDVMRASRDKWRERARVAESTLSEVNRRIGRRAAAR